MRDTNVNSCCITNKRCIDNMKLSIVIDDVNATNYCLCLDYCSWCVEINVKNAPKKNVNCYLCCCTVHMK